MKVNELILKLDSLLSDQVTKEIMEKVGKRGAEIIKNRTRDGQGVARNNGKAAPLKPLASSTINQRRWARKVGKLSPKTSPSKSNLTYTGNMLDSLDSSATRNEATVFIKNAAGKRAARYAGEARPFMKFSKSEAGELVRIIETEIQNDINKKGL